LNQALRSPTGTTSVIADHTMNTTSLSFAASLTAFYHCHHTPTAAATTDHRSNSRLLPSPTTSTYIFFNVVGVNGF